MKNSAIGMFDSGVGGLTVFKEVINKLPHEDIIYLGDTKRFPYGNKSKETIIKCTKQAIEFLLSKDVKAIVIACGTATSQAIEEVKSMYSIPIIGIIQPTVDYLAKQSQIKNIGVIATTGTIRSKAWETELKKANPNFNIISKACPLLAPMAEEGWIDNEVAKLTIKEYLKGITEVEQLILGCTHYTLFTPIIESELKHKINIINTGVMLSEYLKEFLTERSLECCKKEGDYTIYLTDSATNFKDVAQKFINNTKIKFKETEI